jgi:hypothetical protein
MCCLLWSFMGTRILLITMTVRPLQMANHMLYPSGLRTGRYIMGSKNGGRSKTVKLFNGGVEKSTWSCEANEDVVVHYYIHGFWRWVQCRWKMTIRGTGLHISMRPRQYWTFSGNTFYRPKATNVGERKTNYRVSTMPSQGYVGGHPVKLVREPSTIVENRNLVAMFRCLKPLLMT